MNVTLRGLVKRFRDGTEAVKGIDLDIAKGEFVTLLGPSGCGKTTTLRLIAGLEEPTEGSIALDGADNLLVNREYVAASMDVHEPVGIGARVGLAVRASRVSLVDAESGRSLSPAG